MYIKCIFFIRSTVIVQNVLGCVYPLKIHLNDMAHTCLLKQRVKELRATIFYAINVIYI